MFRLFILSVSRCLEIYETVQKIKFLDIFKNVLRFFHFSNNTLKFEDVFF